MGFDRLGTFLGGAVSAVCSVGRSICSGVASFASTISEVAKGVAPVIVEGLKEITKVLAEIKIPEVIVTTVEIIAEVVEFIGKKLGLIDEENTAEELGFKAQEADKKPDDFDSIEEYIEYLRDEIEIDREKFDNLKDEEKLSCSAIGSTILAKGISEKKGVELSGEFLAEVAKQKMKGEEVDKYIDNFKKNGLKMDLMKDYLRCELSPEEDKKVGTIFKETIKQLNPDFTQSDIEEKIDKMTEISLKDFK